MGKLTGCKFGDIIVNHWASKSNPLRRGVFVKRKKRTIVLTDMKGRFWELCNDHDSKSEIIGNVVNRLELNLNKDIVEG